MPGFGILRIDSFRLVGVVISTSCLVVKISYSVLDKIYEQLLGWMIEI